LRRHEPTLPILCIGVVPLRGETTQLAGEEGEQPQKIGRGSRGKMLRM
jgi:hypothetical protein